MRTLPEQASSQSHISSFVVRCLPDALERVISAAQALPGVEVHGSDASGKLVALLEHESEKALVTTIGVIEQLPGVINASMVYHHVE